MSKWRDLGTPLKLWLQSITNRVIHILTPTPQPKLLGQYSNDKTPEFEYIWNINFCLKKCKFSTPSFTFCVKLGEHGQNSYKHISEMGMILLYIYTSLFFYSILYSGIFWWKLQNFLIFSNFCPETSFVWIFLRIGFRALRPKYEKFVLSQCLSGFFSCDILC